jgi:alpha-1,2-mannosyltransferase
VPILAAIVVAVFGDVLQNEFLNGQVNLIVLALAAAAIHVGGRHPRLAGPLLGAAIALKLTPALFLLYWLVERRYRIVVESVLWAVVFVLSPWLIVRDRLWPMYDGYVREFILARTASIDIRAEAIFFTPYGFWEWLTGSVPGRSAILLASALVAGALIAWHTRVGRQSVETSRATGWMYAAVTPLLTPMSEVHHLTMLIPAGMVSAGRVWHSRLVAAASAAFVVLIWIARFDRPGPWYFLSVLCLVASAAIALRGANHSGKGLFESGASAGRRWGWGSTRNASPSSRLPRVSGASDASAGRRWGWGPTAN